MEAWKSTGFVTYPDLPDGRARSWSRLLTPGWQAMKGSRWKRLAADAVACRAHNQVILASSSDRQSLTRRCDRTASQLYRTAAVFAEGAEAALPGASGGEQKVEGPMPHSRHTLPTRTREKWKKTRSAVETGAAGATQSLVARAMRCGRSRSATAPPLLHRRKRTPRPSKVRGSHVHPPITATRVHAAPNTVKKTGQGAPMAPSPHIAAAAGQPGAAGPPYPNAISRCARFYTTRLGCPVAAAAKASPGW